MLIRQELDLLMCVRYCVLEYHGKAGDCYEDEDEIDETRRHVFVPETVFGSPLEYYRSSKIYSQPSFHDSRVLHCNAGKYIPTTHPER